MTKYFGTNQIFPLEVYDKHIMSFPLSALVHISSLKPIGSRADIMT